MKVSPSFMKRFTAKDALSSLLSENKDKLEQMFALIDVNGKVVNVEKKDKLSENNKRWGGEKWVHTAEDTFQNSFYFLLLVFIVYYIYNNVILE